MVARLVLLHEILDHLPAGACVLDLGARDGSFSASDYPHLVIIRVDAKRPRVAKGCEVQTDAAQLPFRSGTFDAAILNHSLEHMTAMKRVLQEVGRVIKRPAAVFVSVPNARTLTDRIYRKVFVNRGGHVNLFDSADELAKTLSWYFGLPHVATRELYSGFAFLNRKNITSLATRSQMRFGGFREPWLRLVTTALRSWDLRFQTRLSLYGWAFYFGHVGEPVDPRPRMNVCIRCGAAHASEWLDRLQLVRRKWVLLAGYDCPECKAANIFVRDGSRDPRLSQR